MFGSFLKKKLSNAIQEGILISENLQQQYRARVYAPSESDVNLGDSSGVVVASTGSLQDLNMAAGCNLLAKYEDDWRAIHLANEENGGKAAQIAAQIEAIEQRTKAQCLVMTDLITCLSGMPALVAKVKNSMEALSDITALTATAEQELESLQDLCDECELQEFMLHKQFELSKYKQKKMTDLELYRQKVAAEHQAKIQQHEEHLRQIQRERQAVFDDAFRGDMEEFKQRGIIPKIHKDTKKQVALEEVLLEDSVTKDALEEFLNG